MVSDAYGGTHGGRPEARDHGAQARPGAARHAHGRAPRRSIGIVATMSTSFYPPFMLARLCSTIDHIADGRFGWNIVTSAEDRAAQNFGMDKLSEHDHRYDMADEYVDLVCQLWDSLGAGRGRLDRETGTYADHTKVRTDRLRGQVLQVARPAEHGALAAGPAGRSSRPAARRRAATSRRSTPTSIIAVGNGVEEMKEYRDDIRAASQRTAASPTTARCCSCVTRSSAETDDEAPRKKLRPTDHRPHSSSTSLAEISLDHRDRLLAVRPRRAAAAADHQRRAGLAREVRAGGQRQDAARLVSMPAASSDSIELVGTPERSPTRWARRWKRSAATASSSARSASDRSTSPKSAKASFLRCNARD